MTIPQRDLDVFNRHLVVASTILLPAEVKRVQIQIAIFAINGFAEKTPVDTGRARAGYQAKIDSPPTSDVFLLDEVEGETISMAVTEIKKLQALPGFHTLFIHSLVPYIEILEQGSSSQAPGGMIRLTMAEVRQRLANLTMGPKTVLLRLQSRRGPRRGIGTTSIL